MSDHVWNKPHSPVSRFRGLVMPREHGSWSLAFEPVALGLIAAPSVAGGWLALAVTAGFFARRPLRIAFRDREAETRASAWSAAIGCLLVTIAGLSGAIYWGGFDWLHWLIPTALGSVIFLWFDLSNAGRAEIAEVTGAAAFSALPAAFAILAGWSHLHAIALAVLMLGRAVPTVLGVRAYLRAAKTGVRRIGPALIAAGGAFAAGVYLRWTHSGPTTWLVLLALLMLRTTAWLVFPRPALRARTLGLIEAIIGCAFVLIAGWAAR